MNNKWKLKTTTTLTMYTIQGDTRNKKNKKQIHRREEEWKKEPPPHSPEKSDETCSMNRTKSKSRGEVRGRKRQRKGTRVHELINICIPERRRRREDPVRCSVTFLCPFHCLSTLIFSYKERRLLSLSLFLSLCLLVASSLTSLFYSSSIKQFFRTLDETFPLLFSLARSRSPWQRDRQIHTRDDEDRGRGRGRESKEKDG